MASQTDKKEEFRRYLEKSNVLATLTNILTDLFEMEMRPDDPGQYLYHKFGESLGKPPTSPAQPKKDDQEVHRGDASTNHITSIAPTDLISSPKPTQDILQPEPVPNKVDAVMSEPPNGANETPPTNPPAQPSGTDQTEGQEGPATLLTVNAPIPTPKDNPELPVAQDSPGESAQPASTTTLGQPANLAIPPAGSSGQSSGDPTASNTPGLSPSSTAQ